MYRSRIDVSAISIPEFVKYFEATVSKKQKHRARAVDEQREFTS